MILSGSPAILPYHANKVMSCPEATPLFHAESMQRIVHQLATEKDSTILCRRILEFLAELHNASDDQHQSSDTRLAQVHCRHKLITDVGGYLPGQRTIYCTLVPPPLHHSTPRVGTSSRPGCDRYQNRKPQQYCRQDQVFRRCKSLRFEHPTLLPRRRAQNLISFQPDVLPREMWCCVGQIQKKGGLRFR